MKTIRLYGELGKEFGREFKLDVQNPAEAVHALSQVVPGFLAYLVENANAYYKVFVGGSSRSAETLQDPTGESEVIRISPVIQGAGGDMFNVILGAALIVIAGPASWATSFGLLGTGMAATLVTNIGFALVLGGIASMLAPTPQAQSPAEKPQNLPSYNFDGAVNTMAQGHPVPLAYGRLIVGSQVISSGLETVQG